MQYFTPFLKEPTRETAVERCIEQLLQLYENNGFPFVNISLHNVILSEKNNSLHCSVLVNIEEGPLVYLEEYHLKGNTSTKTEVIMRELRMKSGELYVQKNVEKIPKRLQHLDLFSAVSEPELLITENGGALHIAVQERKFTTFDGVVGYVPSSGERKRFVAGFINVSSNNLFGTGRKTIVRWQRDDAFSQEIFLSYMEPWIMNVPLNVTGSFFQRKQDSLFVRRIFEVKTAVFLTDEFTANVHVSQENIIASNMLTSVHSSDAMFLGAEILYDARDNIFFTTDGEKISVQFYEGKKNVERHSRAYLQRFFADGELYRSLAANHIIATTFHSREVQSKKLEGTDLFQFGGATTLRGYREKQFLGSRIVWTTAEYRFLFSPQAYAFVFFDAAYFSRPATNFATSAEQFLYGYGFGMRLETALGFVGVSFALGKGDAFSQTKMHLQLINSF